MDSLKSDQIFNFILYWFLHQVPLMLFVQQFHEYSVWIVVQLQQYIVILTFLMLLYYQEHFLLHQVLFCKQKFLKSLPCQITVLGKHLNFPLIKDPNILEGGVIRVETTHGWVSIAHIAEQMKAATTMASVRWV